MTNTADLVSGIETVQVDITDIRGQAAQALRCAEDLADSAAAHGWQGVAASTRAACDALEVQAADLLQGLQDSLDQARRDVDDVKAKTDTERVEAASWGN